MDPLKKPENGTEEEVKKVDSPQTDNVAPETPATSADAPAVETPSKPDESSDAPAESAPDAPDPAEEKPADTAPSEPSAPELPASDSGTPGDKPADAPAAAETPADAPAAPAESAPVKPETPLGDVASTWNEAAKEVSTPATGDQPHISAPDTPPPAHEGSVSVGGMAAAGGVTAATVGAAKGGKKMRTLALIVAAAVLLLLAGGASALYYVMNKPQNVLDMALSNSFSSKAKSASFDGEVTGTDKDKKQTFSVTFNGAADQEGKFDVSAKVDAVVTTVTADLRSTDGSSYFVKVGGLKGLPELLAKDNAAEAKMIGSAVSLVNDQWLEINQSLIKDMTGSDVSLKLSDSDRTKIEEAYKANRFLVVKQTLVDQEIKGQGAHHYRVGVDKAKLKSFYADLQKANIESMKITSDQVKELNKSLDQSKIDSYLVDVWIGKGDRLFKQVGYVMTNDDKSTVSFRLTVDKYGVAVNVEKPADAKSLLDVLGQFYSQNGLGDMNSMGGGDMSNNPLMGLPGGISL